MAFALPLAEVGAETVLPAMAETIGPQLLKTAGSALATAGTVGGSIYGGYKTGKKVYKEVRGVTHDLSKASHELHRAWGHVTGSTQKTHPEHVTPIFK
jgi:hypothetical protein